MIPSYSQPATKQDLWVANRFASYGIHGRKFLEIGAYDGLHHSNTRALEEHYGWTGTLVEPNPTLATQCRLNRPNCQLVQQAVAPSFMRDGGFYLGGSYGGLAQYMPDEFRVEHVARRTPTTVVDCIPMLRLTQLCGYHVYIDYLSLDVEGAEYAILEDYKSSGEPTEFGVITVEFRYDALLLKKLESLLEERYILEHTEAFDAFFVNRNLGWLATGSGRFSHE